MIDGIIKYHFDFEPSMPLDDSLCSEINATRKRLFALKLIGVSSEGIGYGNISQRVNKDSFVITGTQTGHLSKLNASHYSLIKEYRDQEFYLKSTGAIKPSSEALTHGTIYNLSDKIGAVIHIHSNKIWQFMLNKDYLSTAKVEYGSSEMIEAVNQIYKDIDPLSNPKFVMAGHKEGIMSFGRNLYEAELNLFGVLGDYLAQNPL